MMIMKHSIRVRLVRKIWVVVVVYMRRYGEKKFYDVVDIEEGRWGLWWEWISKVEVDYQWRVIIVVVVFRWRYGIYKMFALS